jgi:hypothetical protein
VLLDRLHLGHINFLGFIDGCHQLFDNIYIEAGASHQILLAMRGRLEQTVEGFHHLNHSSKVSIENSMRLRLRTRWC